MTPSRSGALTIALLAQRSIRVLGDRDFLEKQKGMRIKGSTKDPPSYRMIQSVDAEALIKKTADCFRLNEAELIKKRGRAPGRWKE